MIPRRNRLSRPGFTALSRAKRASSAHFLVFLAYAGPHKGAAAVVPKKVAPRSVDRHLLKRRILAILGPYAREGGAVVVHAKRGALALPYPLLRAELTALLHSAIAPATHH